MNDQHDAPDSAGDAAGPRAAPRPAAARHAAAVHRPVMLDVEGPVLGAADRRRLAHALTGGVILFGKNWVDRRQLCALTADIRALRPDLIIAVDHEGGRVQRFRGDGFTALPPMRALGELWMRDALAAERAAHAVGYVLAAELRACGVDLSFAPVLDLDHGRSAVVGDRALHRDARVVSMLARALVHGMAQAGMAHCGKHFPGHGWAEADSHVALPRDERTLEAILDDDAVPYRTLGPALAAVMPAHVVYPKVDKLPAGFSHRWLRLLRRDLRFAGVIFSDDLAMAGAQLPGRKPTRVTTAALAALAAGCDQVLICQRPDLADELLGGLADAVAAGRLLLGADSAQRLAALKPAAAAPDWQALQKEERYLHCLQEVKALSAA